MASTWTGFTEEEKANIRLNYDHGDSVGNGVNQIEDISRDIPGGMRQAILANTKKSPRKSQMKSDGPLCVGNLVNDLPPEALLISKQKAKVAESPSHVKLKIAEDGSFEIVETKALSSDEVSGESKDNQLEANQSTTVSTPPSDLMENGEKKEKINLDEFERRQKLIEEQNRIKKEMLGKALALRKMKTQAEAQKLQQIQAELSQLDASLSNDVSILRSHIEVASIELSDAEKRYIKAEKEFIEAKQLLYSKRERKELLTEHLCAIIEQNELRKAHRLTDLMEQLSQQDEVAEIALKGISDCQLKSTAPLEEMVNNAPI